MHPSMSASNPNPNPNSNPNLSIQSIYLSACFGCACKFTCTTRRDVDQWLDVLSPGPRGAFEPRVDVLSPGPRGVGVDRARPNRNPDPNPGPRGVGRAGDGAGVDDMEGKGEGRQWAGVGVGVGAGSGSEMDVLEGIEREHGLLGAFEQLGRAAHHLCDLLLHRFRSPDGPNPNPNPETIMTNADLSAVLGRRLG